MDKCTAVVSVYDPCVELVAAIKGLQISGFDVNQLSIVGKDYRTEAQTVDDYTAGDRMKVWCQLANFWGGLSGLLLGSSFNFLSGIGPVIIFGPLVKWIVRALEGGVDNCELSALGAGLYSVGIEKNWIVKYETALKSDKFLLVAHDGAGETARADSILMTTGAIRLPALRRESPLLRTFAIDARTPVVGGRDVQHRYRRP